MILRRNESKADYGQDVPGLVRAKLLFGGILAVEGIYIIRRWMYSQHHMVRLLSLLGVVAHVGSVLALLEGLALIGGSRIGKLRLRDRLLDELHLQGNETVLDVGCGHGLLLIGAAKRLPGGKTVGIDLWSQIDQGDNSKAATLENAQFEGVLDRVEVLDGDMCALPFAENSFDRVVASQAIHNLENPKERFLAIAEIVRVLSPGGQVALMDIFFVDEYARALTAHGMQNVHVSGPSFWYYPPVRTVTAQKR